MNEGLMKKYSINLRLVLQRKRILAPSKYTESWKMDIIKSDFITLEGEEKIPVDSVPLLQKILDKGKILYKLPSIKQIQRFHLQQIKTLPPKFLDLESLENYPVLYSKQLEAETRQFKPQ